MEFVRFALDDSIAKYLSVIKELQSLAIRAGKKPYTISVGKLNVAKLANFLDIDVFVLVACPETTALIDGKEFLKPIISPYEFGLSLGHLLEKDPISLFTSWTVDFQSFLQERTESHKFDEILPEPRSTEKPLCQSTKSSSGSSTRNVLRIEYDWDQSSSAQRLHQKSFHGLEPLTLEESSNNRAIIEGSFGTAMRYSVEKDH